MPRYKLTIAYDGTGFCGWQKQEPLTAPPEQRAAYAPGTPLIPTEREGRVALRTVQGVLEQALREVVREPVELTGASRTDAGVHARGQVAAFSCEPRDQEFAVAPEPAPAPLAKPSSPIAPSDSTDPASLAPPAPARRCGWPLERGGARLVAALNSRLPEDVVVLDAAPAAHHFDPISDCTGKGYSYTFHVSPHRPLWDRQFVHHVWDPRGLDLAAMADAASILVGEHDFAAFAAAGHGRQTTVRTVFTCSVSQRPTGPQLAGDSAPERRVAIEISGSGFLWNMVRIIAGTLMQVGLGQRTPADVLSALQGRDRVKSGPTLPPTGLCLEWISYQERSP